MTLSWLLLRGGGRRDLGTQLLAAAAFTVATCLFLLTLGVNLGFTHRAERTAWTAPVAATDVSKVRAIQVTSEDFYDGRPITVVALARPAGAPGRVLVPPGLPAVPDPGQTWLSPALSKLVAADPEALKQRWPGKIAGTISPAGLATPNALAVVIGTEPTSARLRTPVVQDVSRPGALGGPTPITGFTRQARPESDVIIYQDLSKIAAVLLIVPLLVLGGAAARLGLARRDQRLATVRLVGASSTQIFSMVAVEAAVTAAVGAFGGLLLYVALIPLMARIPFAGGAWFTSDLWVGTPVASVALVGVVLGGIASAITTLRRVVVTPLGVAQRHATRERHLWRALVFIAAVLGYLKLTHNKDASLANVVIPFALVFLALSLLGPLVMVWLGRAMVAGAHGPARLLAGRRILQDPKAAWRVVGGLALTGFVAGFLALFPTVDNQIVFGRADAIDVAVPAAHATRDQAAADRSLRAAGLSQKVRLSSGRGAMSLITVGSRGQTAGLSVPVTAQTRERTRSALHEALPGLPMATGADLADRDGQFGQDIHRASTAVLIASFLVAIASAGITACAGVLDRRRTYQLLHLAGMPLRLLDEARQNETTAPLLVLVGGSLLTGLVCSSPLTKFGLGGGHLDLPSLLLLVVTVTAGLVGVRLASAASWPLLRAVATDTSSRPD